MKEAKCGCGHIVKLPDNYIPNEIPCPLCGKSIPVSGIVPPASSPTPEKPELTVKRGDPNTCKKHPGKKPVGKCNTCEKPICIQCRKEFGYFCSEECKSKIKEQKEKMSDTNLEELGKKHKKAEKISSIIKTTVKVLFLSLITFTAYQFFFKPKIKEVWNISLDEYGPVVSSLIKDDNAYLLTEKDWLLDVALKSGTILKKFNIPVEYKVEGGYFRSIYSSLSDFSVDKLKITNGSNILVNGKAYLALYSPADNSIKWIVDTPFSTFNPFGIIEGNKYFASLKYTPYSNEQMKEKLFFLDPQLTEIDIYKKDTGKFAKKINLTSQVTSCAILNDSIFVSTIKYNFDSDIFKTTEETHCYAIKDSVIKWRKQGQHMLCQAGNAILISDAENAQLINDQCKTLWKLNKGWFTVKDVYDNYVMLVSRDSLILVDSDTGKTIWSEKSLGLSPIAITGNNLVIEKTHIKNQLIETEEKEKDSGLGQQIKYLAEIHSGFTIEQGENSTISYINLPHGNTEKNLEVEGSGIKISDKLIATAKYNLNVDILNASSGFNVLNSNVIYYLYDKGGQELWHYPYDKNGNLIGIYNNGALVQTYKTDFTGRSIKKYNVNLILLRK